MAFSIKWTGITAHLSKLLRAEINGETSPVPQIVHLLNKRYHYAKWLHVMKLAGFACGRIFHLKLQRLYPAISPIIYHQYLHQGKHKISNVSKQNFTED